MNATRLLSGLLAGALLFAPVPGTAQVYPPIAGAESRVTTAPADQFDPAVSGDIVVYTDFSGVDADVWYTDLATGTAHPVTTAPGDQQLTGVSGSGVVYTDWNTMDVMLFDIATGQTVNLTNAAGSNALDPAIHGELVAWTDDRDGNAEIYARNLATGEERRISNDAQVDQSPEVRDGIIVWERCDGYACDVLAYEWATGATRQLTATPYASERFPAVSGRTVVFQREYGTPIRTDIVAVNLDGGPERVLPLGEEQWGGGAPHISGDFVSFNFSVSGAPGIPRIGLWHLATNVVSQVTTGLAGQYLNDIDGRRIVYSDNRNGTLDIYLFQFLPPEAPVANAGLDQTVHQGSVVTLQGSGSDPDGAYPLSFFWNIASKPAGSTATLSDYETATPSFGTDLAGDYVVSLVVTDIHGFASAPDTVTISTRNTAPVAAAGPDQLILLLGSAVRLDGTASYDEDGDAIAYLWTMTSRPAGSAAALSGAATATPTFAADARGDYSVELRVTDSLGAVSVPDWVTVSFNNVRPVAEAGANQAVVAPSTVRLDGSASADANGDPLTYRWGLVSAPAGSRAGLAAPTAAQTSFVADLPGQYVVSLVVSDGELESEADHATITATGGTQAVNEALREAIAAVNATPAAAFRNPNLANALTNKIAAAMRMVEEGRYAEALDKLLNDVLAKTDGCVADGKPDKNDWVTSCAEQDTLWTELMQAIQMLRLLV